MIKPDRKTSMTVREPKDILVENVLEVKELRTSFFTDKGVVNAVDGVSFSVAPGEALGIVGESGSGKSVTALSLMRLLDEPARIIGGSVLFKGKDILEASKEELRAMRGDELAMVFQDPMTSLNPVLKIARQLIETMVVHGHYETDVATNRTVDLLGRMGVTAPERAVNSYPHQFSGGMRQRVMLALGMSNDPALLIADEPTTALDVTIQAQILNLLRELNEHYGTSIILISHDLGVIARVCTRVVVMYGGEVVEEGETEKLLSKPQHPYTWALVNAVPRIDEQRPTDRLLTTIEGQPPDPFSLPKGCRFAPRCPFKIDECANHPELLVIDDDRKSRCWVTQKGGSLPERAKALDRFEAKLAESSQIVDMDLDNILVIDGLTKHFPLPKNSFFRAASVVHAVDNVSFSIRRGETVGLVGESGCGKSTIARLVTRIHRPDSGNIIFNGNNIAQATPESIRPMRRQMQMIFQDPYSSLNPRMTVGQILAEPLKFHGITKDEFETKNAVSNLLDIVGLNPSYSDRFPHEFSGGQRQRISIARAISLKPAFIVADEPISALDVNIQAQVINLMLKLQEDMQLTYLFISHDLAVVRHISDKIVVLYLGKVMEIASAEELFKFPLHPYTQYLIASIPIPDVAAERSRITLQLSGELPSAVSPPSGCRFRTRCPLAQPICADIAPEVREVANQHFVACHFADTLTRGGVQ